MIREMDSDLARADSMTPFSLSLAAEKAIENAKRQLDAMDGRLLKARMTMVRAQRAGHRTISNPERYDPRQQGPRDGQQQVQRRSHHRVQSLSATTQAARGQSINDGLGAGAAAAIEEEEEDFERKAVEMKRLRDDLRHLRSKMGQTRGLTTTLNTTPPRPPRPLDSELPDFALLRNAQATERDSLVQAFPSPPRTSPSKEGRPFSMAWPSFVGTTTTTTPGSEAGAGADSYFEAPVIASHAENPFSPRPYSSQSILTPLPSSPYPDRGGHGMTTTMDTSSLSAGSNWSLLHNNQASSATSSPYTPPATITQGEALLASRHERPKVIFPAHRPALSSTTSAVSRSSYTTADESFEGHGTGSKRPASPGAESLQRTSGTSGSVTSGSTLSDGGTGSTRTSGGHEREDDDDNIVHDDEEEEEEEKGDRRGEGVGERTPLARSPQQPSPRSTTPVRSRIPLSPSRLPVAQTAPAAGGVARQSIRGSSGIPSPSSSPSSKLRQCPTNTHSISSRQLGDEASSIGVVGSGGNNDPAAALMSRMERVLSRMSVGLHPSMPQDTAHRDFDDDGQIRRRAEGIEDEDDAERVRRMRSRQRRKLAAALAILEDEDSDASS